MTTANLYPEDALSVLDALPVGLFIEDADGTIIWANETLGQQLGEPVDTLLGRQRDDLPMASTLKVLKQSNPVYIPNNRQDTCLRILSAPIADATHAAAVYTVIDITDLAAQGRFIPELRQPASLDPETGLMTRKSIHQDLVSEVSRSRRYENPLSVILLRVGETVSEAEQKLLMKSVASGLKDNMRWVDLVGLWEINECLIVLPETDGEAARLLVEKLGAYFDSCEVQMTISVGVAAWEKGDDTAALLRRVEQQIAEHKAA